MAAPPPGGIPEAEVDVDEQLVRRLLGSQHPDLAELPLRFVAEGFDNVTVRCGPDLALRLPRRRLGASMLEVELRWLPAIAALLPMATPAALRSGVSTAEYPWRWAVVPWIEGTTAAERPPAPGEARRLGEFLSALHRLPLPADAPVNPYRGNTLRSSGALRERIDRLEDLGEPAGTDFDALRSMLEAGIAARGDVPPTWLHGDLHPRNVIVDSGRISGVIDWGDMCMGQPYTDLAAAWLFFDPAHHEPIWEIYEPTDVTLVQARAWAVAFGAMLFEAGRSGDALLEAIGRLTLSRIVG